MMVVVSLRSVGGLIRSWMDQSVHMSALFGPFRYLDPLLFRTSILRLVHVVVAVGFDTFRHGVRSKFAEPLQRDRLDDHLAHVDRLLLGTVEHFGRLGIEDD